MAVGASAVEGGAVEAGLAGQGLDVAAAADGDVAAEEPVHGGADTAFFLGSLVGADAHVSPDCLGGVRRGRRSRRPRAGHGRGRLAAGPSRSCGWVRGCRGTPWWWWPARPRWVGDKRGGWL